MMKLTAAAAMRVTVLAAILLIASAPGARGQESVGWNRADSIIATIGDMPILETDILMEVDLGLLGSKYLGDDPDLLLEAYLNRMLILREVEEVGAFRLTSGQAEGAYQGYLQRYENEEAYLDKLKTWGVDEEEVRRRLKRALVASLYTESRIQFFINVLPSDIEKAYEENRERWGEASLYEAWETIRSELLEKTYRGERDRWLKTLRERYDLKVYRPKGAHE